MSLLLLLQFGVAARAETADERQAAKDAFKQGMRLYEVADFAKALEAFKRAYLHVDQPVLLFNMGQCYRQLGDKQEALRFYRTYLHKLPDAPNRDEVRRMIASLELALSQERSARAAPPTSAIGPNGASTAASPPPEMVETRPVEHPVAAEAPLPPPVETRPSPTVVPPAADSGISAHHEAHRTPIYKKWWLWTAVGVVVAGVAVGVGVGLSESKGPTQFPLVHVP